MDPRPISALVVVNSLNLGGTERMLERMVATLTESGGVRFTVCSLGDEGPIGGRLRFKGIEVIPLGARGSAASVVLRGALGVRRLLRERPFDLVHSFLYRSHCVARLARFGLARPIPLVSSERCLGDNRPSLVRFVNRLSSRWSDRFLAVSGAVRDRIVQRDRVPPGKVTVVPNGVEVARADPSAGERLRTCLGIPANCLVFLMLGRLHPEKGAELFLTALSLLTSRVAVEWQAILVGAGPEGESLKRMAASLGLQERVMFAGARRFVDPWIDASDVLVLPSREEGMPVAALEAMAKGKPVVATRVGGTPEVVVDGDTGLLVPPEDPERLARALAELARDRSARQEMGNRGMLRARSVFSLERMANGILRAYEDVLKRPSRPYAAVKEDVLLRVSGE